MTKITRRQFTSASLATVGAAVLGRAAAEEPAAMAGEGPAAGLPAVRWGEHEISRVLVGHNPIKGTSHFSGELSREMKQFFSDDHAHGLELLKRSEECGINACQMGGTAIEDLLRRHYAAGRSMHWIATFYSAPGQGEAELQRILKMDPKPIGAQHFGGTTDRLARQGKLDKALDTIKMLQDAGLLAGLCTHNWEVIDRAANAGWEVDFYQGSFYRSCDSLQPSRRGEIFEEEARQGMARVLAHVSQPAIAYKVLGANRHCNTPLAVEAAIRFAFERLKPTDVVLLGMWQKHKDQVAENTAFARKALGVA